MSFFYIEPEVAGGLGDDTVIDTTVWPPHVSALDYEFEDWDGSAIIESFPCFAVTEDAAELIKQKRLTGAKLANMQISLSENFEDLREDKQLPRFLWLQINGVAGNEDFGIADDNRLVISQRALEVLEQLGIPDAEVAPFP